MKRKTSPMVIVGIVVGVLVYALAGYFLLISPQRGKSADLGRQIVATQKQIDQYRLLARQAKATPPIRVAELFRLTKAMPDEVDMAGLVLELSRIARETGIEFDSVTPQGPGAASGYQMVPITLVFDGNYYELSDFLYRMRNLVRVRSGRLYAGGRLFVVDSINFSESERSFPRIKATLTVKAFVYGTAPVPGQPAPPPPAATTTAPGSTTQASTTSQTPEPVEPGASAVGAGP